MKDLSAVSNPYGDDKVIHNCGLFGAMNLSGKVFSGSVVTRAIALMHDRGNGLGGGFAAYGIYPEWEELYALHIMLQSPSAKDEVDAFVRENFAIAHDERIPTQPTAGIQNPPLLWRYFVETPRERDGFQSPDDYVMDKVMVINTTLNDAFVFSSGKNMGVFKGVGFPEDLSHFFCLADYEGYIWVAHSRFPTNTQAWWGGAHPFCILDWTVVHNGEISSYGINRRFLEMYGYYCTMHTDTEVIAYAVDLLRRRHRLPIEMVAKVLAAPLWSEIELLPPPERDVLMRLRQVYGSLLLNGPFAIIVSHNGEMIGLGDRVRLRPLVAATGGDMFYLSSEEAAVRLVDSKVERVWIPKGGEPIVGTLQRREVRYHRRELVSAAG